MLLRWLHPTLFTYVYIYIIKKLFLDAVISPCCTEAARSLKSDSTLGLWQQRTITPAGLSSAMPCMSEAEGRPQAQCMRLSRSLRGFSTLAAQPGHWGQAPRASAMSERLAAASATCTEGMKRGKGVGAGILQPLQSSGPPQVRAWSRSLTEGACTLLLLLLLLCLDHFVSLPEPWSASAVHLHALGQASLRATEGGREKVQRA